MKLLAAGMAAALAGSLFAAPAFAIQDQGEGEHAAPQKAVVVLLPTIGSDVRGTIYFEEKDGKVHVTGEVSGLKPNSKHGFHVHQFGDLTDLKEGKSAGGHFAHQGDKHGKQTDPADQRHTGDLGNIEANGSGVAKIDITDEVLTLHGEGSIIGRGVVVHKDEDKFTQPTGDAGGRAAIGVIGVAKTEQK